MSGVLRDVLHALRWLRASPGFATVAIATVALGIGATTAIFSVANAALLKPLPFVDSDRLALVYGTKPREGADLLPLSLPDFVDFRAANRSFAQLAVWVLGRSTLTGGAEPELVQHAVVSAELLPLLGVSPTYGRTFRPQEDRRGLPPVAIVSDGLWQRRFGADPSIVGKSLILDGQPVTVVGVLPASFRFLSFPSDTDVWLPLGQDSFVDRQYAREVRSVGAIGRLGAGVTWAAASAEAEAIARDLRTRHPGANAGRSLRVIPLREQAARHARNGVIILLGAVGFLLLIACANVANLLFARGTARRRELAIRAAVGASRWRVTRQLLVEALALSAIGGALGVALAVWAVDLLKLVPISSASFFTPYTIAPADVAVDARVLVFALATTVGVALLFGTAPALQATAVDLLTELKDSPLTGRTSRPRVRETLVVVETALALVLLVGSGLLLRSFIRLQAVDIGFTPEQAVAFDLQLSPSRYADPAQSVAMVSTVTDRLAHLPGVRAVGGSEFLPFTGLDSSTGVVIDGASDDPAGVERRAHYRSITPDYLRAVGMNVVAGRALTPRDGIGAPRVALVNQAMAQRYWSGVSPIGKRVALTVESLRFFRDRPPALEPALGMREIVGVVGSTRHGGFDTAPVPEMYVPFAQRPVSHFTVVVRSSESSSALSAAIRQTVSAIDPDQPIANVRSLTDLVDASLARPRFHTVLLAIFAVLALALATLGVYGVLAYAVSLRTREFGVRMALGMPARDGARLVLTDGLRLPLTGVALGLVGALAMSRALSTLLFEVPATDVPTYAAVTSVLVVTCVLTCLLPARRAMAVDPVTALRHE